MGKKRRLAKTSAIPGTDTREEERRRKNVDGAQSSDEPRIRHTEGLYASQETYECTVNRGCIPCAYKICCFDVALDKEFCKRTPNQRPEQCPRSKDDNNISKKGVMGFRPGMSVLTVGDGDFTFSLGLARKLLQSRKAVSEDGNDKTLVVATSYETEATLRRVYPDFDDTLRELDELGVIVAYRVDATRIPETLGVIKNAKGRFHRICWNFPCTAIGGGQDGQNTAMEENKNLVRNFVQSARSVLTDRGDGELYMCHKTKPPYNQWNLEEVALSQQKRDEECRGSPPLLFYSGRIVLDRFLLPPYTPRKALDKKSFPCHDACFYIFAQERSHESTTSNSKKLYEPTIPCKDVDLASQDNEIDNSISQSKLTTLVKIGPELIRAIRQRHIISSPGKKRKR